jgi:hypothetical protein
LIRRSRDDNAALVTEYLRFRGSPWEPPPVMLFIRRFQAYLASPLSNVASGSSDCASSNPAQPLVDYSAIEAYVEACASSFSHRDHAVGSQSSHVSHGEGASRATRAAMPRWQNGMWQVPSSHRSAEASSSAEVTRVQRQRHATLSAKEQQAADGQLFQAWGQPIPEFVRLAVQAIASTLPASKASSSTTKAHEHIDST